MGTTRSLGFIWKRKRFSSNTLRFRIVFSRPRENELVTGNGAIFDGSMGIYWYPTPWRTLRTDVVSCIERIKQTNYATGKRRERHRNAKSHAREKPPARRVPWRNLFSITSVFFHTYVTSTANPLRFEKSPPWRTFFEKIRFRLPFLTGCDQTEQKYPFYFFKRI